MGSSAPPHEDHPPLKVPRQTTAAVQVAYPVNTKTHQRPLPALLVLLVIIPPINLLPLPARPAHPVSTPTPLHHPTVRPAPKARTTIKTLPLLSNHAQPARKESTQIQLLALPANFALRVNY